MRHVDAAARLGVHETQVAEVVEHPAGHVVSLRSGMRMLITETVARVYLPDVDDSATAGFVEPGKLLVIGESGPEEPTPKAKPVKATSKKVAG